MGQIICFVLLDGSTTTFCRVILLPTSIDRAIPQVVNISLRSLGGCIGTPLQYPHLSSIILVRAWCAESALGLPPQRIQRPRRGRMGQIICFVLLDGSTTTFCRVILLPTSIDRAIPQVVNISLRSLGECIGTPLQYPHLSSIIFVRAWCAESAVGLPPQRIQRPSDMMSW